MNFFLHFCLSDQGNAAQEGKCDEEGEGRKQGGHQGDFAGELMVTAYGETPTIAWNPSLSTL